MLVEFCGFEWDSIKNEANKKKHGISFENAIRVFNDPCLLEKYDALHSSHDEERYASLGLLDGIVILFISHTDRNGKITGYVSQLFVIEELKREYANRHNEEVSRLKELIGTSIISKKI